MQGILNERNITEDEVEELEDRQANPEKYEEEEFDPEFEFKVNRPKETMAPSYLTREQVAALLRASEGDFNPVEPEWPAKTYPPLPREVAERLVREHYEYLAEQKAKRQDTQKSLDLVMATRIAENKVEQKPAQETKEPKKKKK